MYHSGEALAYRISERDYPDAPALPTAPWSQNALAYAASTPGFGQGISQAVALVDRWARAATPS